MEDEEYSGRGHSSLLTDFPSRRNRRTKTIVGTAVAVGIVLVIIALTIGIVYYFVWGPNNEWDPAKPLESANWVLSENILIDTHNDLPWALREGYGSNVTTLDLLVNQSGKTDTDFFRAKAGHLGGQFWSVYVSCDMGNYSVQATMEQIDLVYRMALAYPESMEIVQTAAQFEAVFKKGKIASVMGVEGGHSINSSMAVLRLFYQLGVRYMTLTHNCNTPWADCAICNPDNDGLSPFGVQIIQEMNRLGMLVDISHVSPATMSDALNATQAPVIFSHSNAYSLCESPRNVPDNILKLTQQNGGVICVVFFRNFLSLNPNATVNVSTVADQIDYIKNLIGVDHIGIGSDFDGTGGPPTLPIGLQSVADYPNLFAELVSRGYSQNDIAKIAGGNLLRALGQAEKVAARLQKTLQPSIAQLTPE